MVTKTTKYEQKQRDRFARREKERRDLLRRLSRQDPLCDIYKPLIHALTNLVREFTLIDKDIICAYLKNHKSIRNEEEDVQ